MICEVQHQLVILSRHSSSEAPLAACWLAVLPIIWIVAVRFRISNKSTRSNRVHSQHYWICTMISTKDTYLILYNCALTVGWAMVWAITVHYVVTEYMVYPSFTEALSQVYAADGLAIMLDISQTLALLEIVHAATGLVRSPVAVTFMQVASRMVALFALVASQRAQST
jgi:Protein tyrosine phosphatase-like protein, PTPLA